MNRAQVYLSLLTTFLVVFLFWFLQFYGMEQFVTNRDIYSRLNSLEHINSEMENEFLQLELSSFPNYDTLVKLQKLQKQSIGELKGHHQLHASHHKATVARIAELAGLIESKHPSLLEWQSLYSTLRNSSLYTNNLSQRLVKEPRVRRHPNQLESIATMGNQLALLYSTRSSEGIRHFDEQLALLKNSFKGTRGEHLSFYNLLAHAQVFSQGYPRYIELYHIRTKDFTQAQYLIQEARNSFAMEDQKEVRWLIQLSYLIFLFILISEFSFLFYLFRFSRSSIKDRLTGLPNRLAFEKEKSHQSDAAFVLINIKEFRKVNNLFGTKVGDQVLIKVSHRLGKLPLEEFVVYRLGGDEFGILFSNTTEEAQLQWICEEITKAIENRPFVHDKLSIQLEPVIATTMTQPFLNSSNMAMSQLKNDKKRAIIHYSESLGLEAIARKKYNVLQSLQEAIEDDRIIPVFQPIVNLETGKIEKYECLIRMQKENGELLSPFFFLDLAIEANYDDQLTKIMFNKSAAMMKGYDCSFSINLSAHDLTDPEMTAWIFNWVQENPELGSKLTVEVLETDEIEDFDQINAFITQFKKLGVKIAIDDFGSGYSNYENILKLNVDYLKIDGSLIKDIDQNQNSFKISKSIINFAHEMGIAVIVEFVHSESVLKVVKELGADFGQGYHLGKPLPELLE